MDKSNNKHGLMVVLAVVGLVVGAAIAYPIGHSAGKNSAGNKSNATSSQTATTDSDGVTVGGVKMVKDKDIVDNAVNANNLTTAVATIKAAGLVDILKGEGPFTVFMPTDSAFDKLPANTMDTLLLPENKDQLIALLTYHVVMGTYTSADLQAMANKGETLTTVQGGVLTPVVQDGTIGIRGANGVVGSVEAADIISSNGVMHTADTVLMQ